MYFSFKDYYTNYNFYNTLIRLLREHEEYFRYNFYIDYCDLTFPFSFWNGSENSNIYHDIYLEPALSEFNQKVMSPLCFDLSNLFLKPTDLYDAHLRVILSIFANEGHYIRIANPELIPLIQEKFSGYFFILSNIVETSLPNFRFIEYFDPAEVIDKKNAVISLGNKCQNCNKEQYLTCLSQEQTSQYNFSMISTIQNCSQQYNVRQFHQDLKTYLSNGFQHFKIEITDTDILLGLLVKPEYQYIVYREVKAGENYND